MVTKTGGGKVGDNNSLTILLYWLDKKCHFKKLHFGHFFSVRICKVSQFIDFFTASCGVSA